MVLSEISADLASDLDFASYFISQFVISGIPFSVISGTPVLTSNALNGRPGYRFEMGYSADTVVSIPSGFTVALVLNDIDSLGPPWTGKILTVNSGVHSGYIHMLGMNQLGYANGTSNLAKILLHNDPAAVILRQSAVRADLWVNGGVSDKGAVTWAGADRLTIGDIVNGVSGYFCYVAVFDSALSIAAINQVFAGISAMFGGGPIPVATEA